MSSIHEIYDIGKILGEGGYAVVKEGIHKSTGKIFAIKVMKREHLDDNSEKSIRSEVGTLQSLSHPNIIRGYEFYEEPQFFHFIMEKVDGGELFDRIVRKTHYNEKEARDLTHVLLTAIKYLHDHHIAHRDIKPENLLMTSSEDDANVKIVDFGFAARVNGLSLSSQCGTPSYVAPEILANKLHGTPVDMWSFGVILFILLAGYPPFFDNDRNVMFRKIKQGTFEFHPDFWTNISQDAKHLITGLLTVNPLLRLTVDQALAHPWLSDNKDYQKRLSYSNLTNTQQEISRLQVRKRFKKGVNVVKAIHRMRTQGWVDVESGVMIEEVPHEVNARYDFGDKLGEGGYGVVRSGVNKFDKSEVAIKIIKKTKIDAQVEKTIMNEVSILQSLNHSNIVRAFEFFKDPENFYLVLEKITGGELFDRIVAKQFYNEYEARKALVAVLNAIKYCHDHNIVHRDLKPENLLLTSSNEDADIKLVDFGFAAIVKGENLKDQCGTPNYVAPEIILAKPHGKPVDMWSLGVILYILLGGYPPFHDDNQKKLYEKIKAVNYIFHEKYWNAVSIEAKDLITSLLVFDPRKRLTVDQALSHPWLQIEENSNAAEAALHSALDGLRSFQARKRFKKGIYTVMASNKMIHLMKGIKAAFAAHKSNEMLEGALHSLDTHYIVSDKIGDGGYAVVHAGKSKVDDHDVAIKVFNRDSLTAELEEGIRSEVNILQTINHQNIVGFLDFFEEKSHFYLVLERISGGELFDRIIAKTFYSEREARDLAHVLLRAIKYLHDHNIAHRDLKPENLLLTSTDNDADLKIVDFGFAAYTDGLNLSDQVGTAAYIAPEIIEKKLHGTPVDMWSFGVILYILLAGYAPFHDDDVEVLFRRIKAGVFAFHEEYWNEISEEAKDLIQRCLTTNPLARYTADQALAHPWLANNEELHILLSRRNLSRTQIELKKMQAKKRFKKGVNAIKAINRMKHHLTGDEHEPEIEGNESK